jgi:hypothetical protein
MLKTLTFLAIIAILGLSSCKKDKASGDPAYCSADWVVEVEDEYDALFAAWAAYIIDMSVEKCNAYKDAYQDYIAALGPFLECEAWTSAEREEVQNAMIVRNSNE